MYNLINFIVDLKNNIREKQGISSDTKNFLLNNFENEINAIDLSNDLNVYYEIYSNTIWLKKFDPVAMNINLNYLLNSCKKRSLVRPYTGSSGLYFAWESRIKEIKNMESLNFGNCNMDDLASFYCCYNLKEVNFYNWYFPYKIYSGRNMFNCCNNLEYVNLENWNPINKLNNMDSAFRNCTNLKEVFLNNWDMSDLQTSASVFWNNTFTNVPSDCKVWVKDDIAYQSIKSVWPSLKVQVCAPLGVGETSKICKIMAGTEKSYSISFYGYSEDIENHNLSVGWESLDSNRFVEYAEDGYPTINYEKNTIDFTLRGKTIGTAGEFRITLNDQSGNIILITINTEIIEYVAQSYTVTDVSGASYNFVLNSNEYYESQNKGVQSSYAVCRIDFSGSNTLILDCINSGENNYDFGILSNIDTTLSLSSSADTTGVFKSFKGESSNSVVSITYSNIDSSDHFIYVKFIKDGSQDSGNDSLQFKVRFE